MNTLNPNLHIICGKCGCNNMLTFRIIQELVEIDDNDKYIMKDKVSILCANCHTITRLDDIIKQDN